MFHDFIFHAKAWAMHLIPIYGSRFITALGWTLLDSFWQALIILLGQQILLAMASRAVARVKYRISSAALLAVFSCFGITFIRELSSLPVIPPNTPSQILASVNGPVFLSPFPPPVTPDLLQRLQVFFPLLAILYFTGIAFFALRLLAKYLHTRIIQSNGRILPGQSWQNHLERLMERLSITRPVRLMISSRIDVPLMAGWIKPIILLPLAAMNCLSPDQIEAILLHELAHIKRMDYLVNLLQCVIDTLLFFNPFAWMISRSVRRERESCCDDLVVSKVNPMRYVLALVALEENRLDRTTLAMAAMTTRHQLFHRIKRIMEMKKSNLNYGQQMLAVLVVAAAIASVAWLNPARKLPQGKIHSTEMHPYRIAPAGKADTDIQESVADTVSPLPAAVPVTAPPANQPTQPIPPPPPPAPQAERMNREMERLDAQIQQLSMRQARLADSLGLLNSRSMEEHMRRWETTHGKAYWLNMQKQLEDQASHMAVRFKKMDWGNLNRNWAMDSTFRKMDWKKWQMNFDSLGKADWIKADSLSMVIWPKIKYRINLTMDSLKYHINLKMDSLKKIHWSADMDKIMAQNRKAMIKEKWNMAHMNMMYFPDRINMTVPMVEQMKAENLIHNPDRFRIDLSSKGLFIDGRKQTTAVYEQYRNMIGPHGSVRINYDHGHETASFDTGTSNSSKKNP